MSIAKEILKDDWYKTASREDMAIALHRLERETIDNLTKFIANEVMQTGRDLIEKSYEESKQ